jgi:hypothetical protein
MMVDPPSDTGAVQETRAEALPATAVTPVGEPGTGAGVTEADGVDGSLTPRELAAITVKVYGVLLVSPDTAQLRVPVVEQLWPSGLAVTL